MLHDLRDAVRSLTRAPAYTLTAIAVLALGIGATTSIFSFVDAVLLRPLPYPNPERIVFVFEKPPGGLRNGVATAQFLDWRDQNDVFEAMAATTSSTMTLAGAGDTARLRVGRVSTGYFGVFGIRPVLGRTLKADDEQPGRDRVVVLSNRTWQSVFGADPTLVGREIVLDGQAFTVIGVLPAASAFDRGRTEVWRPLVFGPGERARNYHWLQVVARLKPGVKIEQAKSRMEPIAARIAHDYPDIKKDWGITLDRFSDLVVNTDLRQSLNMLMAAVGMLLLVGCANLANIAMARGTAREREVVVRAALGASRSRITRQLLTESLLLSLTGGALGIATGYAMTRGLQLLMPPYYLPREALVTIDGRVMLFVLGISVATALIFGTAPAFHAGRVDLAGSMRASSRAVTVDGGRRRLRDTLIVVEVALACMLLVAAGLLMRSFMRLQQVEAARDPATLVTASLSVPAARFSTPEQALAYQRLLVERLRAVPGTSQVALTSALPLQGWTDGMPLRIPSAKAGEAPAPGGGGFKMVSSSYLSTIGLPILRGRGLEATDTASSTPVVVINQAFANRYFAGVDPIGRHLLIERILPGRRDLGEAVPWEIVGIAANERTGSLGSDESRGMYATLNAVSPVRAERRRPDVERGDERDGGAQGGRARDRSESAPHRHADPRGHQERVARRRSAAHLARRRLQRHRARARRDWHLRRHRLFGGAAHPRDRRPRGARRQPGPGDVARHPSCAAAHGRWARARHRGRGGGHDVHGEPALRRATARSPEHGRRGAVARGRRPPRGLDSGATGRGGRPAGGPANGVNPSG